MAKRASDVWDLSAGFDDGLDVIFTPQEKADKQFADAQRIIDNAYKIDESQATLESRLSEADKKLALNRNTIDYLNRNADDIKAREDEALGLSRLLIENSANQVQSKIDAFDDQSTIQDIFDAISKGETPEGQPLIVKTFKGKDENGNDLFDTEQKIARTDLDRYQMAQAYAPNYRIKAQLKTLENGELAKGASTAIADGDYVEAYKLLQQAGIKRSDTSIKKNGSNYEVTLSGGEVKQYTESQMAAVFFDQKTRQQLVVNEKKAQDAMRLAEYRGKSAKEVANINANSRFALGLLRGGGSASSSGNANGGGVLNSGSGYKPPAVSAPRSAGDSAATSAAPVAAKDNLTEFSKNYIRQISPEDQQAFLVANTSPAEIGSEKYDLAMQTALRKYGTFDEVVRVGKLVQADISKKYVEQSGSAASRGTPSQAVPSSAQARTDAKSVYSGEVPGNLSADDSVAIKAYDDAKELAKQIAQVEDDLRKMTALANKKRVSDEHIKNARTSLENLRRKYDAALVRSGGSMAQRKTSTNNIGALGLSRDYSSVLQ